MATAMQTGFTPVPVGSWDQAKEEFAALAAQGPQWVFRGQRNSEWGLATSLERVLKDLEPLLADPTWRIRVGPETLRREPRELVESIIQSAFARRAHHYIPSVPARTEIVEWLAFMQHHGAPTRLLDVTSSPYIAGYFAVEDAIDTRTPEAAVWAFDKAWLKDQATQRIAAANPTQAPLSADVSDHGVFLSAIYSNTLQLVTNVVPFRMNERLTIQQGSFLCPGDIRISFMDNLAAMPGAEQHIKKIVLPQHVRALALADLSRMNINRATLFPGLDGFAQSLVYSLESLLQYEDVSRLVVQDDQGNFFIA
jgi:hypothetical protein